MADVQAPAREPGGVVELPLGPTLWESVFTVAPLVLVGTKEADGWDFAPKHMAMPLGWAGFYCFACTPEHATYRNVQAHPQFTISFPQPDQILTSSFACGMAFHNTASRYMYSLAREGVLPESLAETHDHHKSPHKASVVQSVLAAVWVLLFAFFNGFNDPNAQAYLGVYTLFAVLGTGLLLVLQAIVSLAIFNWFRKNGGGNVFSTVIAPLFSLVVQLWLVYLLVANLSTFAGTSSFANAIPWLMLAILVVGLLWGFYLKSAKPEAYKHIGHMVHEGE